LIAMPSRRSRPGPEVRAARLDEAAALSALCVRSKAVWGYDGAFMTLAHNALQVSSAQIAAGDVWVATGADGGIAGVVVLNAGDRADTLDLDKLFIEPRHIRAGFGRILLTHAINEARRRGARRLTILSDPYAAAFYERRGAPGRGDVLRCDPRPLAAAIRDQPRVAPQSSIGA
jgi:GNAT superfamily N-acetyltransferase